MRFRQRTYLQITVWVAAAFVGVAAVVYARLIELTQRFYFMLAHEHPYVVALITPALFVAATLVVEKFGPAAKGSGIPQVLEVIEHSHSHILENREPPWSNPLVSLRTAVVKVVSSVLGVLGGASIGREGPTVQIAASIFTWAGRVTRTILPKADFQSFLTAGAAAGVAAAFNAPLAGITFAIEEITEGLLGQYREMIMLAVILSGIVSMALAGNYLYFGHPAVSSTTAVIVPETIILGICGGFFGGLFARLLAYPELIRLPEQSWKRALLCGCVCALVGLYSDSATSGSGYEITRKVLESGSVDQSSFFFGIGKFCTTVMSYLSGMAGGIFSPCLAIGAGIGFSAAKIFSFMNFKVCGLLGMVGFFSGAIQAPLTAVIIVMEMTDEHILIVPFMVTAFLARGIGKQLMPIPLYRFLADKNRDS